MSSYGRYSDGADGPSRNESYTERFRVQDQPMSTLVSSGQVRQDPAERSRLSRLIDRACDPSHLEPNLSLNIEIADLINEKKGNSAREAATQIVKLINSRSSAVSILSLALLDICVKNCGYPFHLQISRKEFLNDLVRKFPERPPPRYTRSQQLILEAIEEWRETICQTSRYKDDLGYIRDMHRLLSYKGYTFPEINRDDAAVLNPSDNIKSAEELEEEERAAQSAKLQELIRRGTPADLLEANHLMKIMAGYDTEHRTDYRAKVAEDLAKIQRKAKLLDEMLDGVRSGDAIGRQDAFEELYNAIKNAQPKIQKIIKDESEDGEAVQKLLSLNDYINSAINKYDTVKAMKRSGSNTPVSQLSRNNSPVPAAPQPTIAPAQAINLIDFDDDVDVSSGSVPPIQPIMLSISPTPAPAQFTYADVASTSASLQPFSSAPTPPQSNAAAVMAQFSVPSSFSTPVAATSQPLSSLFSAPLQQPAPTTITATTTTQQLPSLLTKQIPNLARPQPFTQPVSKSQSAAFLQAFSAPKTALQPSLQPQPEPESVPVPAKLENQTQQQSSTPNTSSNLLDLDGLF
ncbi:VHS domain-containing protein [Lipomyces chichibuensis]|uniref:VHS domain-containing protein n=1 Tax=Lipomyces chichibuensis TaxID=1546026 RepID=UPI00334313DD